MCPCPCLHTSRPHPRAAHLPTPPLRTPCPSLLCPPKSSLPAQQPQERRDFPSVRGERPLPFPAGDDQRELAGWAGAPYRSGSRMFPVRTNLSMSLVFQSQAKPKAGDLIEIFRPGYAHWALYVGDGYVVHLGPPGEAGSPLRLRAEVGVSAAAHSCAVLTQCPDGGLPLAMGCMMLPGRPAAAPLPQQRVRGGRTVGLCSR